jgi:DNA-binding transcriptional LysR family regulator
MEFQQLDMFVAVVETGTVRRAAERVFRTAPAVSIALRKLEEEIGSPLFNRSERNDHRLTETGKLLYSYAKQILEMRREASESLKSLSHAASRDLRLGTHESTSLYLLPSLVQAFNGLQPAARIEVVCGNSETLIKALEDRSIELALIAGPTEDPGLERHLIMRDELVLIVSKNHRLAGRQIYVRDLANEFLIVEGPGSMLRKRIVGAFEKSETPFKVAVENIGIEGIKRMVAQGLGIGFVPLMSVRKELTQGELATVCLSGVRRDWDVWLVWRQELSLSLAAKSFVEVSLSRTRVGDVESRSQSSSKNRRVLSIQHKVIHC